jgi:iron complex outermembrane receptor protein
VPTTFPIPATRPARRRPRPLPLIAAALFGVASLLTPASSAAEPPLDVAAPAAPQQTDPASAEELSELSLEQLMEVPIVAAGKREQSQRQAAAPVSVVTADDIELFGHRNLADVLRNQRGFYLHTDGLNWVTGVRGFLRPGEWNARLLVLVDGRSTRENLYGQSHLDQDFVVPIEAVKRVEIVRGPGSALYGGSAVFGVVNVVTKDGADLNGAQVRVQAGNRDTARVSALYGTRTNDGWDILAGASGFTTNGEHDIEYDGVDDAARNFGHIRGADGEHAHAGFLKVRLGDFTATFDLATRMRDSRAATYAASFFEPGGMHERRGNVTLRFDHDLGGGHRLHAMAYYGHYNYRQDWTYAPDPDFGTPANRYVAESNNDWLGQELHYSWQVDKRLHVMVGADATQSLFAHQRDHDQLGGELLDVSDSYNAWAVFGEVEWQATDWLRLVGGLRRDQIQDVGAQLSPRAAAILTPTPADTVKLLYGRAFRQPNLFELAYASPGVTLSNPDLRSEVVDTYEAVWEHQFKSGWRTSVGGFYWRMDDAMDAVVLPDGASQTQNIGSLSARGIELELQRRWESGASVRLYGTWTRAEDEDGQRLTLSPEWIAGAAIVVPVLGRHTFLSLDTQIVGPMSSDLGESTDPTFVTNVVLTSRRFLGVPNLDFQAGLYNLFADDARLPRGGPFIHSQPTLNWPQTQVLVGLTYRF